MDLFELLLRNISVMLDKDYSPVIIILTLLALAFTKHRRVLILSFLVVMLLTLTLKTFYQEDRPCKAFPALVDCNDFGFPSGHTITSVLLPAATLGSFAFFLFLPLSFLIAFSRVYLGVHSVNQIVAGLSLGMFVYFALERLHERLKTKKIREKGAFARFEEGRQLIHILAGLMVIGMLYWFGLDDDGLAQTELILLGLLITGLMLINMKILGMWIGPFDSVLKKFGRRRDLFGGRGPLMYLVGILLILSYAKQFDYMLAAIAIFAVGDGVSSLVGMRYGVHKLEWNPVKSWEGSLAFFISGAIVAFPFIGIIGLFYSAVLAVIETLDFHIDDNLLVPFVAVLLITFM
ncbi:MAG TPA: phosphatase PAP2 family protein [Candidatus Norongarragalinales archaeon]|nr:phosphatase PAP2 family protein [Candidatus Norongarragalinales archaeon]